MNQIVFDIFGIGIGPFNLGLSALLSRHINIQSKFVDKRPDFQWHEGLLIPGTTLQVPFFADLVSMADPTHPFSYINYLHLHDRLYQFYYYNNFLIPRTEYNHYCQWVVNQLPSCTFSEEVKSVKYEDKQFIIECDSLSEGKKYYSSKHLSIGIGTVPYVPSTLKHSSYPKVIHSSEFIHLQEKLAECQQVTIVGSGQSAAECVLALYQKLSPERIKRGASIRWITHAKGFHPMEYSKLGQECFTPDYMRYFQQLTREKRKHVSLSQGFLYKGISFTTIADIFDLLYERSIGGHPTGLSLYSNCLVEKIDTYTEYEKIDIHYYHEELGQKGVLQTDALILATGYYHCWPEWFEELKREILVTDSDNQYIIQDDFTLLRSDNKEGKIFLQNAEIDQQSVASPDLGVGPYRNAIICNQLLENDFYHIPKKTAFQNYGLPK
ncbi:SidA/IucD/PvdA family monooxygenase [Pelistega sp. NLN82]|uniref:SidA/IucD/PvdA family monooxygenase n=1 Tax=Pelistega ratti TaxID=2652177 RepID=A0A6L9Y4G6_9BURK|nr:SidA/IucD/PvdA family monooxygenase [Pelistega ratti]NEN75319.1 SidA/IucD/PvdA family monooxygenase [Pelistega ratti]